MSTSDQRLSANRANALKSTGPATEEGRSHPRRNATRHGLLSTRLLLDDECPAEFDSLLAELQAALGPVGFLELALVERVAISMWRQRRLVGAETAALTLSRQPTRIAAGLSTELKRGYGSELKEGDLQPFDQDRVAWCNTVIAEIEGLEHIDPDSLPKLAPTLVEQLQSDADEGGESVEAFLASHKDGLTGFVAELLTWCHEQLNEAEQRPRVLALAEDVKSTRSILPPEALEVFSRYQTTLDNQLIKGLRALREAQEWRMKTLDAKGSARAKPVDAAA
jgi:hypothetical protein